MPLIGHQCEFGIAEEFNNADAWLSAKELDWEPRFSVWEGDEIVDLRLLGNEFGAHEHGQFVKGVL